MVSPSEWSEWSWLGGINVELGVCFWQRNSTQSCVVGKITQSLDLGNSEAGGREELIVALSEIVFLVRNGFASIMRKLAQSLARFAVDQESLVADFGKSRAPTGWKSVPIFLSFGEIWW